MEPTEVVKSAYDRSRPVTIWYAGEKREELSLEVRVPSDEEFIARERKIKEVTFADGRKQIFGRKDADTELLSGLISSQPDVSIDEEAAYQVVPEVIRAEVSRVELQDDGNLRVELLVTNEATVATLVRNPRSPEVADYFANYTLPARARFGEVETPRVNFPNARGFFKSIFLSGEGYATPDLDSIPIWHKFHYVQAAATFRTGETQAVRHRKNFK